MTAEELLNMKLHEEINIPTISSDFLTIRRVYQGWIYIFTNIDYDNSQDLNGCYNNKQSRSINTVFVPEGFNAL